MSKYPLGPVASDATAITLTDTTAAFRRLRVLTGLMRQTTADRVEAAALACLLNDGQVTAGDVWSLLRNQYHISDMVSSTSNTAGSDPEFLGPLFRDQHTVWHNLTLVSTGQNPSAPADPRPYEEVSDDLVAAWVDPAVRLLTRLADESRFSGRALLGRFGYELRQAIEHALATNWLGSPLAIGASLEMLPLGGGSGFGLDGQGFYVMKAFADLLHRDIEELSELNPADPQVPELAGRVSLLGMLLKGFVYGMVSKSTGHNVAACLAKHPATVATIKSVLLGAKHFAGHYASVSEPQWGGTALSTLDAEVRNTPMEDLLAQLDSRVQDELDLQEQARLFR